jgi:XTP/dITP diphosphohydrolase
VSQRLLIATRNLGKLREYRQLLAELPLHLVSLVEARVAANVEEAGQSYLENATHKATCYANLSGLPTLADDSGLEVDALDGEPGVGSARFGGPGLSDAERTGLLLQHMEDIPRPERTARFRCVIALATPEGEMATAEGECAGLIAPAPAGEGGFGYDPVFYLPKYRSTMAQLPPEVKNRISHRTAASQRILPHIRKLLQL